MSSPGNFRCREEGLFGLDHQDPVAGLHRRSNVRQGVSHGDGQERKTGESAVSRYMPGVHHRGILLPVHLYCGAFDDEPASFTKMEDFLVGEGYAREGKYYFSQLEINPSVALLNDSMPPYALAEI